MAKRGKGLVARFRRAVRAEERARADDEARRQQELERARVARDELLVDLGDIARDLALGPVTVRPEEVVFHRGDRTLGFHSDDTDERVEVEIRFTGQGDASFRLYREPQLADRWVLAFTRRGRAHRLPLFDQGLEELLILALDLPRPGDDDGGDDPPSNPGTPPTRAL